MRAFSEVHDTGLLCRIASQYTKSVFVLLWFIVCCRDEDGGKF